MQISPLRSFIFSPSGLSAMGRVFWMLAVALFVWVGSSTVFAGESPSELHCLPATGHWSKLASGEVELRGALCSSDAQKSCPEFTSIRFGASPSESIARVAETPGELSFCHLRWLGRLGDLGLYRDGVKLIGVDLNTLKVITDAPIPGLKVALNGFTSTQRGELIELRSSTRLILLARGKLGPEVAFNVPISKLLDAEIWHEDKLLLLQAESIRWWSITPEGRPVGQKTEHLFSPPLEEGWFVLNDDGVLRASPNHRKLSWYSFKSRKSYGGTLHGTEKLLSLSLLGDPPIATAFTQDGAAVHIKSYWGGRVQDRLVRSYWLLPNESDDGGPALPSAWGAGDFILVDGRFHRRDSVRARIMLLSTSPSHAWTFKKDLVPPKAGRPVLMTTKRLLLFHAKGNAAMTLWRLPFKGSPKKTISRADFRALGFEGAPVFETYNKDYWLLRDAKKKGVTAFFNPSTGRLSSASPTLFSDGVLKKEPLQFQGSLLFEELWIGADGKHEVARWHLLGTEDVEGADTAWLPSARVESAFDSNTRWFGYCIPGRPCHSQLIRGDVSLDEIGDLSRKLSQVSPVKRPLTIPNMIIIATLVGMLLLFFWRLGIGRGARKRLNLRPPPAELLPLDIETLGEFHDGIGMGGSVSMSMTFLEAVTMSEDDDLENGVLISEDRMLLQMDGDSLSLLGQDGGLLTLPLDENLRLELTRQSDFAQMSISGLLSVVLYSEREEEKTEISFDVLLPPSLRSLERIPYRDQTRSLRTTWAAFAALKNELHRINPDLQDVLYRKLVRKAHEGEPPLATPSQYMDTSRLDEKGRRFISRDDRDRFVRPSIWMLWPVRWLFSFIGGAGISAYTAGAYLGAEPFNIVLTIMISLALPASAILWVLFSWGVWNRAYLLRFGSAVEGFWIDEQVLQYTLVDGRTFRIRRKPWEQADLVPVVLYDPRRPAFAVHFTGHRNLGSAPSSTPLGRVKRSKRFDSIRFVLSMMLLGGCMFGSLHAFQEIFPEPLPSASFRQLSNDSAAEKTLLLPPCYELCMPLSEEDQVSCQIQCQQLQLQLALKQGGIALEQPPEALPGHLRLGLVSELEALVSVLKTDEAGVSCSSLAGEVKKTPRWSQKMRASFKAIYGASEWMMSADPELQKAEKRFETLQKDFFVPLCVPSALCLSSGSGCGAPPRCEGDIMDLRDAICSLAKSSQPLRASSVDP